MVLNPFYNVVWDFHEFVIPKEQPQKGWSGFIVITHFIATSAL